MPWPSAPEGDGRLAGEHAGAAPAPRASSSGTGGDEVERGSDGALGVVLLRVGRAPDRP